MSTPPVFDVLLSFAGPERAYARAIYDICTANGLRVFLDEEFQHEIWGEHLVEYLSDMYSGRGRYCVILVLEAYASGKYPRVERQAALDAMLQHAPDYILPVRVDDVKLPGVSENKAYLDLRKLGVIGICEILKRKASGSTDRIGIPAHVRVPRIPIGKLPAEHLTTHLLGDGARHRHIVSSVPKPRLLFFAPAERVFRRGKDDAGLSVAAPFHRFHR